LWLNGRLPGPAVASPDPNQFAFQNAMAIKW
jgi:hypothetical protein